MAAYVPYPSINGIFLWYQVVSDDNHQCRDPILHYPLAKDNRSMDPIGSVSPVRGALPQISDACNRTPQPRKGSTTTGSRIN